MLLFSFHYGKLLHGHLVGGLQALGIPLSLTSVILHQDLFWLTMSPSLVAFLSILHLLLILLLSESAPEHAVHANSDFCLFNIPSALPLYCYTNITATLFFLFGYFISGKASGQCMKLTKALSGKLAWFCMNLVDAV